MKKTILAVAAGALALSTSLAFAGDQGSLIHPTSKELTFVFVPKVIHPWYDVVQAGGKYAVEEGVVDLQEQKRDAGEHG